MIVYGGRVGGGANPVLNDGKRYSPATNAWTSMADGPSARFFHTAVSTGSTMLVWGGSDNLGVLQKSGGLYSPDTNTWAALPTAGAPEGRYQHSAVWTGSEMIVWGGTTTFNTPYAYTVTGGRYDPAATSWTATGFGGAPAARNRPNAVWSGTEMIIWGGTAGSGFNTGGRYRTGQTFYLYQRP